MDCQCGGSGTVDSIKGDTMRLDLNPPLTQRDYSDYYGTLNGCRIGLERDGSGSPWFYLIIPIAGSQKAGMLDDSIKKPIGWALEQVCPLIPAPPCARQAGGLVDT